MSRIVWPAAFAIVAMASWALRPESRVLGTFRPIVPQMRISA